MLLLVRQLGGEYRGGDSAVPSAAQPVVHCSLSVVAQSHIAYRRFFYSPRQIKGFCQSNKKMSTVFLVFCPQPVDNFS
jgi:hypothetical protein